MLAKLLVVLLPWRIKRFALQRFYGYDLAPSAHIGLAWFFPRRLVMGPGARVAHLNVAVNLDLVQLGENTTIGRSNWITGFPTGTTSNHFAHRQDRSSTLVVGRESAITKHHHLDCTDVVSIGDFVTVAGYRSQIMTHSIDVEHGRQDSRPITIGDYCFVGGMSLILGGSSLPHHCVLGGMSLLNRAFEEPYTLYAGNPAAARKTLSPDAKYFTRLRGYVD